VTNFASETARENMGRSWGGIQVKRSNGPLDHELFFIRYLRNVIVIELGVQGREKNGVNGIQKEMGIDLDGMVERGRYMK
jgi:hypothetical protein